MAKRGSVYKNWNVIKTDFVTTGATITDLHHKYKISRFAISKRKGEEDWVKLREEFLSTTFRENIKEAQIIYVRDRMKEAANFAGLKRILKEAIMMVKLDGCNLKDMADLARAICQLEEREAVLCGEVSQRTEGHISAQIAQQVKEVSGMDAKQLEEEFQKEQQKLLGPGSGMVKPPPANGEDNGK